jgi:hypothetical protein
MGIYFGTEKEDASESTTLTNVMNQADEVRRSGKVPVPDED